MRVFDFCVLKKSVGWTSKSSCCRDCCEVLWLSPLLHALYSQIYAFVSKPKAFFLFDPSTWNLKLLVPNRADATAIASAPPLLPRTSVGSSTASDLDAVPEVERSESYRISDVDFGY